MAAVIGATGCSYSVAFDDCQVTCAASDTCPADLACIAGMCRANGATGACGSNMGSSGDSTLTQTADTNIDHSLQFGCANSDTTTAEGSWYRVFSLSAAGIDSTFHVERVTLGICFADAGIGSGSAANPQLDVKLGTYSGSVGTSTLDLTKIKQLTAMSVRPPPTDITELIDVPIMADVPGNSNLVVEIHNADFKGTGQKIDLGATDGDQTADAYLRSPLCSLNVPTSTTMAGNPNAHIVITVTGSH